MRRLLHYVLPHLLLFLFVSLPFIQGCTRYVLQTYPAEEHEIESVTAAFQRYQDMNNEVCGCCLDAEADAAFYVSRWFSGHTGNLSGYLQAMEPSHIKFIATNPLGQPWFIFLTNGNMFKSLNVFEEKVYLGSVRSEAYKKFVPRGFDPEFSYYWLTGRLHPGYGQINAVMRHKEHNSFWLHMTNDAQGLDSMVLFDPDDLVILRHVLRNERGEHLMDVVYADYQPIAEQTNKPETNEPDSIPAFNAEKALCKIPTRITVSSNASAEKIEVKLHSLIDDAHFSDEDFLLKVPDNFEQLFVN